MLPDLHRSLRLLCAAALVAAALVAVPGAVAAQGQPVSVFACAGSGGEATVPAGEPVTLRWGWGDKNKGLTVSFLNNMSQVATVDGQSVLGSLTKSGPMKSTGMWVVYWYYQLEPLAAGASVEVFVEQSLRHQTVDGITLDPDTGHLFHMQPGVFASATCVVTAE